MKVRSVIISRTDAIGDVVLTLPMARLLKQMQGNETRIIFFGKSYTQPVIECCTAVDEFINYDTFSKLDDSGKKDFLKSVNADCIIHVFPRQDISASAKAAGIKIRIGTTGRLHHWFNCNRLVRMTRKNSDLHEAQLNAKLLKPLGYEGTISIQELAAQNEMKINGKLPDEIRNLLSKNKFKLVLHPKSHASAREWSLENFSKLIELLPEDKFQIIITGGEKEAGLLNEWVKTIPKNVINTAGKLSLPELIALLNETDGIVAASTGPLHISAALGKKAIGIYPPIKPMDPGRWAPIGKKAEFVVLERNCSDCRFNPHSCHCINEVAASHVARRIN